jgi:hypothetical protein
MLGVDLDGSRRVLTIKKDRLDDHQGDQEPSDAESDDTSL